MPFAVPVRMRSRLAATIARNAGSFLNVEDTSSLRLPAEKSKL
jgi:hypothetical protein